MKKTFIGEEEVYQAIMHAEDDRFRRELFNTMLNWETWTTESGEKSFTVLDVMQIAISAYDEIIYDQADIIRDQAIGLRDLVKKTIFTAE